MSGTGAGSAVGSLGSGPDAPNAHRAQFFRLTHNRSGVILEAL